MANRTSPTGKPLSAREWIATYYSVPARIVTVLSVLASAWGFAAAVGDPDGENPISWLMFLAPALAGAFPTLELAWHPQRDLSMSSIKPRWFIFPMFGALGAVIAMGITEIVLRSSGVWAAAQAADQWHYWFPADGPSGPSILFGLLGYAGGLLLALAFFVIVLWPLQIFARPHQAIEENMMDSSAKNFRRNRAALALMPLIVIVAFVIAIALTMEIGWLAVVSIIVEVGLVTTAAFLQRVDRKRRRAAGMPLGVELGRKDEPDAGK